MVSFRALCSSGQCVMDVVLLCLSLVTQCPWRTYSVHAWLHPRDRPHSSTFTFLPNRKRWLNQTNIKIIKKCVVWSDPWAILITHFYVDRISALSFTGNFFEEYAKYSRIFLGEFFLWISLLRCELCFVFVIKPCFTNSPRQFLVHLKTVIFQSTQNRKIFYEWFFKGGSTQNRWVEIFWRIRWIF